MKSISINVDVKDTAADIELLLIHMAKLVEVGGIDKGMLDDRFARIEWHVKHEAGEWQIKK